MGASALPKTSQERRRRFSGPSVRADGSCEFRIFAPEKKSVSLTFSNDGLNWFTRKMSLNHAGEFQCIERDIKSGARYWYIINGKDGYPDPWSRCQPDGPHEASKIVSDLSFTWNDDEWSGRPWNEAVIYELHVGTFTPEGTFLSAITRLDHLQKLGITVLQIMPVWTSPQGPSWGYDANYLFSVNANYGTPDDFKRFVGEAHQRGIQVVLDVIYNHLGIEGNYLSKFNEEWLSPDQENKWGAMLNFDGQGCKPVREMVVSNALFWLWEFHLDGLRIDAPIEIKDNSKSHILEKMALAIRAEFSPERHVHLILENDHYSGRIGFEDGTRLYNASINITGGERLINLINMDLGNPSANEIQSLMESLKGNIGFEFTSSLPAGPSIDEMLHSDRQILGAQNHDLVGNQPDPQRIWAKLDSKWHELVLAIICLTPSVPTFFMGDEFGCEQVFPFFCNYSDVSESDVLGGRAQEFEFSNNDESNYSPFSNDAFNAAIVKWPTDAGMPDCANYRAIKMLLEKRQQFIQPLCAESRIVSSTHKHEGSCHRIVWSYRSGERLVFELSFNGCSNTKFENDRFYQLDGEDWSAGWWIEQ